MGSNKTLTIKGRNKIIYSIKVNDDVLWEGENVHEVYPMLKETYRERDLSITWQAKKGTELVK